MLTTPGGANFGPSGPETDSEKHELKRPRTVGTRRADFEALHQRHSREVWALAYARWMNADTAMDVTQEAFLRLWKQWEAGEEILNPRAWLLRVARNLAEDIAKSAFGAMARIRRRP